ncbi:MAG TPA: pyridoxamine 5'-phosphate oxidase family protein [Pseudonocardiaceae bacterium]
MSRATPAPTGIASAELLDLELAEPSSAAPPSSAWRHSGPPPWIRAAGDVRSPGAHRAQADGGIDQPTTRLRTFTAELSREVGGRAGARPSALATLPDTDAPEDPLPGDECGLPGSRGEHLLQRTYGTEQRARRFYEDQMLDRLNENMIEFVRRMDMAFIATADSRGECDASFRAGPAGFIQVLDERHLAYPEYRGNGVMASLGNISENPHVGILMIDFVTDLIGLHVNGRASIVEDADLRAEHPELPQEFERGRTPERWVVVEVEEAYIHCRKHIPRMIPVARNRAWGTDDVKRKGGDYFGAKAEAKPWKSEDESRKDDRGAESRPEPVKAERAEGTSPESPRRTESAVREEAERVVLGLPRLPESASTGDAGTVLLDRSRRSESKDEPGTMLLGFPRRTESAVREGAERVVLGLPRLPESASTGDAGTVLLDRSQRPEPKPTGDAGTVLLDRSRRSESKDESETKLVEQPPQHTEPTAQEEAGSVTRESSRHAESTSTGDMGTRLLQVPQRPESPSAGDAGTVLLDKPQRSESKDGPGTLPLETSQRSENGHQDSAD